MTEQLRHVCCITWVSRAVSTWTSPYPGETPHAPRVHLCPD